MFDKYLKISISLGLLIISLSLSYYFVIFIPKKESIRIEREDQEKDRKIKEENDKKKNDATKEILLLEWRQDCLKKVDEERQLFWNKQCKTRGLKDDCPLPQTIFDRIETSMQTEKENCFKLTNIPNN